eukprot:GHVS01080130.1.p1 GENE.GHVS01080130.1~~GHVS01080130.1.p1  ORF type:complete len:225 (-),score=68.05 GHVS01080130.1:94-669(-)
MAASAVSPLISPTTTATAASSVAAVMPQVMLKTSLTKETAKELSRSFKWQKAFSSCKIVGLVSPVCMTQEEKLKRYTNFSLEHIYEKYRGLQTHLMVRESVLFCSANDNPEIIDNHISRMPTLWIDILKQTKDKQINNNNVGEEKELVGVGGEGGRGNGGKLSVLEIIAKKGCTNANNNNNNNNAFVDKHL